MLLLDDGQLPHVDLQNKEWEDAQDFPNRRGSGIWSRSGTPLLIVWTRESAVEKFAAVYKLDYGEFIEAASWKEVHEYQDEGEEYRIHNTPKIYSTTPLGVFLPY